MIRVYVSIGSNIDREVHITACLEALDKHFTSLELSSVYESEAVGFGGDNFYNLVAGFDTQLSVGKLSALLRQIESDNGRRRVGPRFSSRTLDIDILLYDDLVGTVDNIVLPRDEIVENAFVLLPMAELIPDAVHPVEGKSYRQLWVEFDEEKQKLWKIDFTWRGEVISKG